MLFQGNYLNRGQVRVILPQPQQKWNIIPNQGNRNTLKHVYAYKDRQIRGTKFKPKLCSDTIKSLKSYFYEFLKKKKIMAMQEDFGINIFRVKT